MVVLICLEFWWYELLQQPCEVRQPRPSFWSPSSSRTATLRVFSLIRSECVRFKWAPSAGNGRGWCTQILTTIMVWVAKGKSRGADYVKNLNKSEPALRLGSWFATSLNKTKQGKNSKSIFETACPYWYLFTATALSTHRSDSRVGARMRNNFYSGIKRWRTTWRISDPGFPCMYCM